MEGCAWTAGTSMGMWIGGEENIKHRNQSGSRQLIVVLSGSVCLLSVSAKKGEGGKGWLISKVYTMGGNE